MQKWFGGDVPTARALALTSWVNANKATVQKVVDALVATMHWVSTHTGADIANALPPSFVSNSLITKAEVQHGEQQGQEPVPAHGMMPSDGPRDHPQHQQAGRRRHRAC